VPVSTVARIESGARQPSLITIGRLLAAVGLELRTRLEPYDDHDDVLDARRSALTTEQQHCADAALEQTRGDPRNRSTCGRFEVTVPPLHPELNVVAIVAILAEPADAAWSSGPHVAQGYAETGTASC